MGQPVSPFKVMELERNAARSENRALKLELQQLQQQANHTIQQLAAQVQQMNLFIAGIVHSMGGKLLVPHSSLDALRAAPHRLKENVDAELKVTVIEVVKADAVEQPAPAEAVSDAGEETVEQPSRSLIELVSR